MSTIAEALSRAKDHHRSGQLQVAEQDYRRILQADPDNAQAHYLLGVLYLSLGKSSEAVACLQRSVQLRPQQVEGHNHLGIALMQMGRHGDAIACFREALRLRPGFADAQHNLSLALGESQPPPSAAVGPRAPAPAPHAAAEHNGRGVAFARQGKLAEAVLCFLQAIRLMPESPEYQNNLALALQTPGKTDEAIAGLQQAAREEPGFAEPHFFLGNILMNRGKPAEAEGCYRRAIGLEPRLAGAHTNLGVALREQARLDEAVASLRKAVELRPDMAQSHCLLGLALADRGLPEPAIASYRQALRLDPDFAEAHANLGNVFLERGRLEDAIDCYRRSIAVKPDFVAGHSNLGIALTRRGEPDEAIASFRRAIALKPDDAFSYNQMGNCLKDQGKLDEAIASFRRAIELKPDFARAHSNLVFALPFCPGYDARGVYEENRLWDRRYAEPLAGLIRPHSNDRSPDRRLRVGYVSPNFFTHCQAYFTTPLFAAHDHENFEIFCYSDVLRADDLTARLRSYADVWRDIVGLDHGQVEQMIRRDEIDVLVDLTMHMGRDRLMVFARKPAPVQVCWLAYPGTTGLSAMDYRLTDPYLDPPGLDDRWYSEESIRLPDCFWCYDPLATEPAVNALPALSNGRVTFGSLNNFCKVNDGVLEVWARVLNAVGGSRLIMLAPEGSHRRHVLDRLEREGVAGDRLTFVAHQPRGQYLRLYQGIDLGLDTFPSNGHTTSLDSFWMGVPVVTVVGRTAVGRAGLCQLTNLGLPELIAESHDQFVDIAVGLANDLARLSELRATLRGRIEASPLMDAPRFARNIEAAYRGMWRRWCAG